MQYIIYFSQHFVLSCGGTPGFAAGLADRALVVLRGDNGKVGWRNLCPKSLQGGNIRLFVSRVYIVYIVYIVYVVYTAYIVDTV